VRAFYFDSSALVKRYLTEMGSAWVIALTTPPAGHTLIIVEITRVEVAAALAARHRASGGISRKERDDAVNLLHQHCATDYQLTPVSPLIVDHAVTLTKTIDCEAMMQCNSLPLSL